MGHLTDNMNDFQHAELNSIKTRNSGGGGGWALSEFGHRMQGETAIVMCIRMNSERRTRRTVVYEVDPRGVSKLVDDREEALV